MYRVRLLALRLGLGISLLGAASLAQAQTAAPTPAAAAEPASPTPAPASSPAAATAPVTSQAPAPATGAQPVQLPLPQASPRASVTQTFGLTEVTVDYHAPSVRGRAVWGGLVPYDQIWRAGANENTLIRFSTPVLLRGQTVPAGQYSFYVMPHQDRDWELVLNRVTTHWGAEGYDQRDDVIRVPVIPETAPFHENLLYWFSDIKSTGAHLNLTWEKRTLTLPIETEVHKQVLSGIEQVLQQKPGDWQLLAQAADYLVQNNIEAERALTYINESLRLQDAASNNWIKARLLAQQQDFGTAIVYARKAIKLGDKEDSAFKNQLPSMRIALTEWQAKAY
ncbi:hypothetical protein HNQ93_002428 [Hymenobacter luteus]|uniref:DUF2911 domain-containing protein n=2 Tax=Hymenobacter TaxID=89966 RepID=A0A7W9T2L6_9BACT|nr:MULTISPECIES: DUF2911 domain-containing protein [Hymenobacter]MBB4602003.1 hypothetical protein [Hymenobacter latericoloratus]MBB6059568.1 hypothetical protein [Hymenobacter luteus]